MRTLLREQRGLSPDAHDCLPSRPSPFLTERLVFFMRKGLGQRERGNRKRGGNRQRGGNRHPRGQPLLRLRSSPGAGGPVFDLRQGEMLGVIGPNGSGKSTLIRALTRILPLSRGRIALYGTPLQDYTSARSRARSPSFPSRRRLPSPSPRWTSS